jgi:uncharacterized membrane protein
METNFKFRKSELEALEIEGVLSVNFINEEIIAFVKCQFTNELRKLIFYVKKTVQNKFYLEKSEESEWVSSLEVVKYILDHHLFN